MKDIYENTILCEKCNKKTSKGFILKNGYKLRLWECKDCNEKWFHPLDLQEYNNFQKIKNKQFRVKLRFVGNSYAVSIPREIIDFQEEIRKQINEMLYISLEEPEKLSIYFTKRMKKILNED